METSRRARLRRASISLTSVAAVAFTTGATAALASATAAAPPAASAAASEWTQVRAGAAHTGFNSAETTITKGNVAKLTLANTIIDVGQEGIHGRDARGRAAGSSSCRRRCSTRRRSCGPSTSRPARSCGRPVLGNTSVGTAAAIAGGKLFLLTSTPNSTVFAFDATTGAFLWKTARRLRPVRSPPKARSSPSATAATSSPPSCS